jgi:MraZ protein
MGLIVYNYHYEHGIDEKRRIIIPARWRGDNPNVEYTVVLWKKEVVPDDDLCLLVIPPETMTYVMEQLNKMKVGDPNAEVIRTIIGFHSFQAEIDKSGKILIPEEFAEQAGLKDRALFVGMMNMFAIWNPERFKKVKEKYREKAADAYSIF